jgi:hypothetical protein
VHAAAASGGELVSLAATPAEQPLESELTAASALLTLQRACLPPVQPVAQNAVACSHDHTAGMHASRRFSADRVDGQSCMRDAASARTRDASIPIATPTWRLHSARCNAIPRTRKLSDIFNDCER